MLDGGLAVEAMRIAVERLGRRIGTMSAELQTDPDEALRLNLPL